MANGVRRNHLLDGVVDRGVNRGRDRSDERGCGGGLRWLGPEAATADGAAANGTEPAAEAAGPRWAGT